MASDLEFVTYVADQIADAGTVRFRMMFGEYAVYVDEKVAILVCDNRVFVKPTEPGAAFIGEPVEGAPYPGAKPCFLIGDQLEDRVWMSELARITAKALPAPKPKKPRKKPRKKRARPGKS